MKPKWFALLLVIVEMVAISGCAKCPIADSDVDSETLGLPKGFAVLKGLSDDDYVDGWPSYIVCKKDGSIMTLVARKVYPMGSPEEVNESPVHNVVVDRFYIDLYETTNVQYARFAKAMGGNLNTCLNPTCKLPAWESVSKDHPCLINETITSDTPSCKCCRNFHWKNADCMNSMSCMYRHSITLQPSYFNEFWSAGVNDNHPARAVSFWEAWYYCRWVGKDLPTEAEWELAACGGDGRLYPWGNTEPDSVRPLCNYGGGKPSEDGYEYAAPVCAFASGRSPVGCYNMSGNVWEWVKDNYDATAYSAAKFAEGVGRDGEIERQFVNPVGPRCGDLRVIRGGSFSSEIKDCRNATRQAARPNIHANNIGFRGVLRVW